MDANGLRGARGMKTKPHTWMRNESFLWFHSLAQTWDHRAYGIPLDYANNYIFKLFSSFYQNYDITIFFCACKFHSQMTHCVCRGIWRFWNASSHQWKSVQFCVGIFVWWVFLWWNKIKDVIHWSKGDSLMESIQEFVPWLDANEWTAAAASRTGAIFTKSLYYLHAKTRRHVNIARGRKRERKWVSRILSNLLVPKWNSGLTTICIMYALKMIKSLKMCKLYDSWTRCVPAWEFNMTGTRNYPHCLAIVSFFSWRRFHFKYNIHTNNYHNTHYKPKAFTFQSHRLALGSLMSYFKN